VTSPEEPAEDARVLVLAPYGRDAALAGAMLREAGLDALTCPDLASLEREIGRGAGLAVVAEEALATADAHALSARLAAQPPWSDLPSCCSPAAPAGSSATLRRCARWSCWATSRSSSARSTR
jgi:hypothetical protein